MNIETSPAQMRKNYFWNTLGSLMNAASTVLMLMAVTQTMGAAAGGIFSLAYAIAQQLMVVGHFEIRTYQATDTEEKFPFGVYLGARCITTVCMMVGVVVYSAATQGLTYEGLLFTLIASLRLFDVIEDVFHGMFQQHGRLDIAGRAFFFRVLTTVIAFAVGVVLTKNLLVACLVSFAASAVVMVVLIYAPAKAMESLKPSFDLRFIGKLLLTTTPLFAGSFLLTYVVGAPKYAMASFMSKEYQTFYAVLSMPAMVINLLSNFVFKPLLTDMAERWTSRNTGAFLSLILKGFGVVTLATVLTMVLAWPLGVPVLSALYGLDFSPYQVELMVLLVGGWLNALTVILYYAVVTMRKQVGVLVSYACGAGFAFVASSYFITTWGIMGACLLYDASLLVLAIVFSVFCALGLRGVNVKSSAINNAAGSGSDEAAER